MSRTLAILAALAGLSLGSCMHQTDVAGLGWTYQDDTGEGPKLAYGAPQSDNVVMMMTCRPDGRTVGLSLLGGSPHERLTLASNGSRQAFPATASDHPGDGFMVEADAPLAAGPLAQFEQTGRLTLISRGRTAPLDAAPAERAQVERFFEACRAESAVV